jgi:translation elongation factor EF-4
MRTVKEAFIGGTLQSKGPLLEPLPGFVPAKPMVYAGVYPMDQSEHTMLRGALEKLLLNDASVECKIESR